MDGKIRLALFDFDGTLTRRDTFLEFIRFCFGSGRLYAGLLLFSPLLILMKLRLYPNGKAKQRVFSHFFRGMDERRFEAYCSDFCRLRLPVLLRPEMLREVDRQRAEGARLCIVSASIDRWIRPWALPQGFERVIATELEIRDARLTGHFRTPNCYGAEKVRRLRAIYPLRSTYYVVAYGDSRGDREMMGWADESVRIPGFIWHKAECS